MAPKAMLRMFREGHQRELGRSALRHMAAKGPTDMITPMMMEHGLTLKAFQRALNTLRKRKNWRAVKEAIRIVTGTTMDQERVARYLEVEERPCEHCGGVDSLMHRAFVCPAFQADREAIFTNNEIKEHA